MRQFQHQHNDDYSDDDDDDDDEDYVDDDDDKDDDAGTVWSQGCASLGPHYNPRGARHGSPDNSPLDRHYGDLGNITADQDGRARFRLLDRLVEVNEVIGRSLVVSSDRDDLGLGSAVTSLTDGDCGPGLACGVIARAATLGQNKKKICACDGVTIWDERNKPLAGPGRRSQS